MPQNKSRAGGGAPGPGQSGKLHNESVNNTDRCAVQAPTATREKSPPAATIGPSKRRLSDARTSKSSRSAVLRPLTRLSPAARKLMTPKRLVSWLFDHWEVKFGPNGFLERWSPEAQFETLARGPRACILHVRDVLGLDHLNDDALALAYEDACDDRIVEAARDADRRRSGR